MRKGFILTLFIFIKGSDNSFKTVTMSSGVYTLTHQIQIRKQKQLHNHINNMIISARFVTDCGVTGDTKQKRTSLDMVDTKKGVFYDNINFDR